MDISYPKVMAPKTLNMTVRLATHTTKLTVLADAPTHVIVVLLGAPLAAADDDEMADAEKEGTKDDDIQTNSIFL